MENLQDYTSQLLKQLLEIPSPSGDTKAVMAFVAQALDEIGVGYTVTRKGALICTIPGKNASIQRTLSGHVDTLGAMVKEIKSDGRIKMTQVGGYAWSTIEGEYVEIMTRLGERVEGTVLLSKASVHVYGQEARSLERDENSLEIRLDRDVTKAEDVKSLGISVGDYIYFDARPRIIHDYIKSRHLDDKAGVACMLAIIKQVVDKKVELPFTTNFLISNYEEVGHGSCYIPPKTAEFLAIDMAAPGKGQCSQEKEVTICAKDSSGPYSLALKNKLIEICENQGINYNIDIYPYYSSDASAAVKSGWDIVHGLIGPGVDASHAYERTHIEGLMNTIKLGYHYILDEDLVF